MFRGKLHWVANYPIPVGKMLVVVTATCPGPQPGLQTPEWPGLAPQHSMKPRICPRVGTFSSEEPSQFSFQDMPKRSSQRQHPKIDIHHRPRNGSKELQGQGGQASGLCSGIWEGSHVHQQSPRKPIGPWLTKNRMLQWHPISMLKGWIPLDVNFSIGKHESQPCARSTDRKHLKMS